MPLTREQRQNIAARPTQRLRLVLCKTDDRFRFIVLSERKAAGRVKRTVDVVRIGCDATSPESFQRKRDALAMAKHFGYDVQPDGFLTR